MTCIHDASTYDPTRTTDLRTRLRVDMDKRWQNLKRLTVRAIIDEDMLGLSNSARPGQIGTDPVTAFRGWFATAISRVVLPGGGDWLVPYVDEAASRGLQRAAGALNPTGAYNPRAGEMAHSTVVAAAIGDLIGIAGVVGQQAGQAVANGVLSQLRPRQIAAAVGDRIARVGVVRSRALVNFVVVRAFNRAMLELFRTNGVTHVGTIPERAPHPPVTRDSIFFDVKKKKKKKVENLVEILTAGDDFVCEECEDLSQEGPYPIDEAQNLIPAHPNCRCAFVPFDDDRFANVRE